MTHITAIHDTKYSGTFVECYGCAQLALWYDATSPFVGQVVQTYRSSADPQCGTLYARSLGECDRIDRYRDFKGEYARG